MLKTTSQNNISLSKQIFVGDDMVMSLTANIEMNNPEEMSYSPVILNVKKYFKNLEEISQAQRNFENKVFQKQQELINEYNQEGTYETEI